MTQTFPARPSSLPEIRDFVRRHVSHTPFSEDDIRTLGERTAEVLLTAAGTSGTIEVSLRIFPDRAEVDVLCSTNAPAPRPAQALSPPGSPAVPGASARPGSPAPPPPVAVPNPVPDPVPDPVAPVPAAGFAPPRPGTDEPAVPFTAWLAAALRREGMTLEAAARELGVSVKTVSRWVAGTTQPRLRDLTRMREIFGDLPFP